MECSSSSSHSFSDSADSLSSSSSQQTSTQSAAVSLLDKLRSPKASELSRKRKVQENPSKGKRRHLPRGSQTDPKSVTPSQRVREFPTEQLTVSAGKLFCSACREELGLKRSVVQAHIKAAKHADGKKRLERKEAREKDISEALRKHDQEVHQKGETLPELQRVYRVKVATAFLRAGVPFEKLEYFRELFEENAFRLVDKRYLLDLVPFILKEEQACIRQEIADKPVSVIFDGTSRLGEVMVVVLRFVQDWKIVQRLVRVEFLAKSMTGEEVARELINVLSIKLGIGSELLVAAMRDRASVNNVALRTLSLIYPQLLDVGCFAHTLDHVGEKFSTPILSEFISLWITLFAHSPKCRLIWKTQTERAMQSYSKTRWWSRFEVMHQVMLQFGDVEGFLRNDDVSSVTSSKLLDIMCDVQKKLTLQLELAAVIDIGIHFVKATYNLEGDGPLVLTCFEIIESVRMAVQSAYYPNVNAIARNLSSGNPLLQQQYAAYAVSCLQPGISYFNTAFQVKLQAPMAAFKAARLFSPVKVYELQPSANDVTSVEAFPFLKDPTVIAGLKAELPSYLAKTADVSPDFDCLEWWERNSRELPNWSSAALKVLLVQPSSAAAERVFSLLSNCFSDRQHNCLEDYVEASLMLQYNKR